MRSNNNCQFLDRSRQCRLFAVLLLPHLAMAAGLRSPADGHASGPVAVEESGNSITIGNDYLERTLSIDGSRLRTSKFINKLSHHTYSLSGPEFQIELIDEGPNAVNPLQLTTQDFKVVDHVVEKEAQGGRKITFHLETHRSNLPGFFVDISYELRPEDYYTRQSIKMKSTPGKVLVIHYISVFKDKWDPVAAFDPGAAGSPGPATARHLRLATRRGCPLDGGTIMINSSAVRTKSFCAGLGQPLFGQDLFMGLEYPSGINEANQGEVNLGSYVGLSLPKDGFASARAVLGVSLPGRVHNTFMTYIDRIRMVPPRPYIDYNNFYDTAFRGMNTQNTLERLAELDAHLLKPYSLHLDAFTLDEGWDDPDNLWAPDQNRFPNGFQDVVNALSTLGSNLGLWLGPDGGGEIDQGHVLFYGDHRVRAAAGERLGVEVTSTKQFCLAGAAYNRYLRKTIVDLITKYDVNYFKFDGISFTCDEPDHGDAVDIYSREAITRNVIALAQAMYAANPHIFIDYATGPWLSPWWLLYGNVVDYGGNDFGHIEAIPSPTPRQSAISYRDSTVYQDVNVKRAQLPISSLSSTGVTKMRAVLEGKEESLDDWKDEVINYVGAGNMFMDLLLSPTGHSDELLTAQEWEALGRTLQYFVRNEHPLVDNTTWVLGDPARGEPYGFVHYSDEKTIILLRNPALRPASISLPLTEENGFAATQASLWTDVVYPFRESLPGVLTFGSTLKVSLDGYEQRIFELTPVRGDTPRIEGIRFSQLPSEDGTINYTLYAARDSEAVVHLSNSSLHAQAVVDGRSTEIQMAPDTGQRLIPIQFGRAATGPSQANCQSAPIRTDGKQGSVQLLDVSLSCRIPSDSQQSEMAVLLESGKGINNVESNLLIDGKPAPLAAQKSKLWYWATTALTPGQHTVEFRLRFPSGLSSSAQVSGWLLERRLLETKKLSLVLQRGTNPRPLEEDVLPTSSQIERKTYAVFEQRID
jgi:hypothetical protein